MRERRAYSYGDTFFEEGDLLREHHVKTLPLRLIQQYSSHLQRGFRYAFKKEIRVGGAAQQKDLLAASDGAELVECFVLGCGATFESLLLLEAHYMASHTNVCSECRCVLPTPRLLQLHFSEHHDPFFTVLSSHTKMYECFVEGCIKKFANKHSRKQHLIAAHHYPPTFWTSLRPHKRSTKKKPKESEGQMTNTSKEGETRPKASRKGQRGATLNSGSPTLMELEPRLSKSKLPKKPKPKLKPQKLLADQPPPLPSSPSPQAHPAKDVEEKENRMDCDQSVHDDLAHICRTLPTTLCFGRRQNKGLARPPIVRGLTRERPSQPHES